MNIDGSDVRTVKSFAAYSIRTGAGAWAPDGERLALELQNTGIATPAYGLALYVINIDGTDMRRLTPFALNAGDHPDWSPDGSRILFRSRADVIAPARRCTRCGQTDRPQATHPLQAPDAGAVRLLLTQRQIGHRRSERDPDPTGRLRHARGRHQTPGRDADTSLGQRAGLGPAPAIAARSWSAGVEVGLSGRRRCAADQSGRRLWWRWPLARSGSACPQRDPRPTPSSMAAKARCTAGAVRKLTL
jgi:hypothetical protein